MNVKEKSDGSGGSDWSDRSDLSDLEREKRLRALAEDRALQLSGSCDRRLAETRKLRRAMVLAWGQLGEALGPPFAAEITEEGMTSGPGGGGMSHDVPSDGSDLSDKSDRSG